MTAQSHTCDTRTLLPWLVAQQRRVRGILDGLDDRTLRQPVLPSGWSCAGMVQHQAQTAIALIRDLPLHTPPTWWPDDMFGDWRLDNLHEVLLHLLIETTCHAGHLDAAPRTHRRPYLGLCPRTPERPAMTPTYPAATVPLQGPVRGSGRSTSRTAVSGPRRLWLPVRRW